MNLLFIILELIGNVFKNEDSDEWQINVSYESQTFSFKDYILVLSIENFNKFGWVTTRLRNVPYKTLNIPLDTSENQYLYIGKIKLVKLNLDNLEENLINYAFDKISKKRIMNLKKIIVLASTSKQKVECLNRSMLCGSVVLASLKLLVLDSDISTHSEHFCRRTTSTLNSKNIKNT
ncbi:hypothetical protein BpHYR1_028699 [Brachionus plicatilis]|uniref:Uncharacterized protein n=1 Tax=Brachionus plicatilis TaxID=10195 RepID=A0A3M7Q1U7_BRAPC|nr:hypothetical protein BpHYR1_028699 [Brachionus plicatilis]